MKQSLIDKYEGYIANLQWHLDTNGYNISMSEFNSTKARINAYQEILTDLKMLPDQ